MSSLLPIKAFAIGAALGLVLAVAPSCGSSAGSCSPDNCGSGCCSNGLCLAGTALNACGKAGAQCSTCAAGQSCSAGACGSTFTGGGAGGGGGTGGTGGGGGGVTTCNATNCQTGCCFRNSCFTGRAVDACGTAGVECKACAAENVCTTGVCEVKPDAGTVVVDAGFVCNAATCATGCCIGNACAAGNVVDACGTGGTACNACGTGNLCSAQVCTQSDGGLVDGGGTVVDAGTGFDAGVIDSGVVDAGMTVDAGQVDAGPFDAGTFGGDGGLCNPNVVLSQVYFRGDNTGGYNADFVEIHNRSSVDVNLNGWSIQTEDSDNDNWQISPLSGTLPAYGWVTVRFAVGNDGTPLPTPYLIGLNVKFKETNTGQKIALVSSTAKLAGDCPKASPTVVDFIGYGDFASCWEGGNEGPLAIFSAVTNSYQRSVEACSDTNNNRSDWSSHAVVIRNTSTQGNICPCQNP